MTRRAPDSSQGTLFDPPDVITWFIPIDRYGRDLPPIAVFGADWKPVYVWGPIAVSGANALGPDATLAELYEASTGARHIYYALTGDRKKLELELGRSL